jgi:hypothetical protein
MYLMGWDEEGADGLKRLAPRSRAVPLGLRWRLLINHPAVIFGSLFFAASIVISLPIIAFLIAANPIGLIGLFFPLIGLAVTAGGFCDGVRKVQLLEQGELARATIVTCRFLASSGAELPFEEFRRQWHALHEPGASGAMSPAGGAAWWFLKFWTCLFVVFGISALILNGAILFRILFRNAPLLINGRPADRGTAIWFILGLLVVEAIIFVVMWRGGRRMRSILSGRVSPASLEPNPEVRCTFEYRLPGGDIIRAEDSARFSCRLGDEPAEPVLYDLARPERAILLDGLSPRVRVAPDGAWEAGEGPGAWPRTAVVALCWLGALPIGWIFWSFISRFFA